jgi:2-oxo-4-hydroxy-4-carboxy--5-ureidoimidazoline (OHCU) decarboxylase
MSNVDGKIERFVSDYRDVEGMQFPFIIHIKINDKDEIEIMIKEWVLNSNLEDSFFERPAAWK